ncbi:putative nuclear receptor binding factor [Trypanosoma conorhini]|uniref:Putative nuclear receptor binding factor n=1 Tax=Trypanosoma conorhini TaxID=83891 RepID=A0A3R7MHC3_9TRYP|nr:putative nuclear receptor binding factor [Trypanosoma conorhini]RNF05904.1 putative nuclear receptor binding factor [Trypanosoma conorhini]
MSKFSSKGWRYARCGPIARVLRQETFDVVPAKEDVVVEVLQAPLHRADAAVVNGTALGRRRPPPAAFPRVGGCEGVGKVVAAGGSQTLREGDTVWVAPVHGTWATRVAVDAAAVHKIDPKYAPLAVNAANYVVAQHLLNGFTRLRKGQVVVQNGGSSVTALAVAALAKPLGVRVLTACATGERFDGAKQRHAKYGSEVFEYNGKGARAMRQAIGNVGAALYLNGVGGRHFDTFLGLVGGGGHVVSYGAQNGVGLMFSGANLIYNEVTMQGMYLPAYLAGLSYSERQTQLEFVLQQLHSIGFHYPTAVAASLDQLPSVWDDAFVHGGKKGVVSVGK